MRCIAVATAALCLVGCSRAMVSDRLPPDPGWPRPTANHVNLRAMAADPADLARGHGDRFSLGREVAPPALNLWSGRRAALPASEVNAAPEGKN